MVSSPETTDGSVELNDAYADRTDPQGSVDLNEAARQLELAIHDARVAFDCTGLNDLDRAHTFVITARAAIDSAEALLRAALTSHQVIEPDMDHLAES
jgi:hypothetical protein